MALPGLDSTKKFSITIPAADVPTDEVDVPFLVNIGVASGKTDLDTTAVFTELGASSLKIAAEDGDTGNQCYVEIERWDSVALSAQLWVKIPAVSSTVDTVINFYYDSTQADNTTYVGATTTIPAQNVWDANFVAVYHMVQDPSGTAPQLLDSTVEAHHQATYGAMTSADLVQGLIGMGVIFDGGDDYSQTAATADFSAMETAFTVSVLAKFIVDTGGHNFLFTIGDGASGSPQEGGWYNNDYLYIGTAYNDAEVTDLTVDWGVYHTFTWTLNAGSIYAYRDSVKSINSNAVTIESLASTNLILGSLSANRANATVDCIMFSNVVRSDAWIALTDLTGRDSLGTWLFVGTAPSLSLRLTIDQKFGISSDLRPAWLQSFALLTRLILEQAFSISSDLRPVWEQSFALKTRLILQQLFGDAPTIRRTIYQVFGDAGSVRRAWLQTFGDAVALRRTLEQAFGIASPLRQTIDQDFAITSQALRRVIDQNWSIKDIDVLRRTIYQVFGISGAPGKNLHYTVTTELAGSPVPNPVVITIERDITLYYIDAALEIGGQEHWVRYDYGAEVVITIDGRPYSLVVVTPKRDRKHGGGNYMVDARSPAVRLGPGFAEPVTGELTGFASAIAVDLAPGFSIDWQIQDEYYAPGKLIAAGEYPIDLIRKMALAMKGVVQSNPDGSIKVIYRRPVHVDRRGDVPVDYTLSDADDFFTAAETPERRPGYNKYTVRNQNETSDTLRMESKFIGAAEKEIRGYQTPWTGDFDLVHTGGPWVTIEPLGIEERPVTETIEFVGGKSRAAYPIYGYTEVSWQAANLGTITVSEDGAVESAVAAESLLEITYTTRCRLWRVRDSRNEELQLVSEAGS